MVTQGVVFMCIFGSVADAQGEINRTFSLGLSGWGICLCHRGGHSGSSRAQQDESPLTDVPRPPITVCVWVAQSLPVAGCLVMNAFAWAVCQQISTKLLLVKRREGEPSGPTKLQGKHPRKEETPVQDQSLRVRQAQNPQREVEMVRKEEAISECCVIPEGIRSGENRRKQT